MLICLHHSRCLKIRLPQNRRGRRLVFMYPIPRFSPCLRCLPAHAVAHSGHTLTYVTLISTHAFCRRRRRRKSPPPRSLRRTQMLRSARSPRICSSVRTGGRGSRLKTLTPVSVRVSAPLSTPVRNTHTHVNPGEVGKLLGAKWKELDDSEKKVSNLLFNEMSMSHLGETAVCRAGCQGQVAR